mmetsp:Transcript_37205/g.86785  ORF Transcript_37205/g.86785 Transcript_37205/m.86785 type:complete len:443 (-) Transcript_37205:103-1431(-)
MVRPENNNLEKFRTRKEGEVPCHLSTKCSDMPPSSAPWRGDLKAQKPNKLKMPVSIMDKGRGWGRNTGNSSSHENLPSPPTDRKEKRGEGGWGWEEQKKRKGEEVSEQRGEGGRWGGEQNNDTKIACPATFEVGWKSSSSHKIKNDSWSQSLKIDSKSWIKKISVPMSEPAPFSDALKWKIWKERENKIWNTLNTISSNMEQGHMNRNDSSWNQILMGDITTDHNKNFKGDFQRREFWTKEQNNEVTVDLVSGEMLGGTNECRQQNPHSLKKEKDDKDNNRKLFRPQWKRETDKERTNALGLGTDWNNNDNSRTKVSTYYGTRNISVANCRWGQGAIDSNAKDLPSVLKTERQNPIASSPSAWSRDHTCGASVIKEKMHTGKCWAGGSKKEAHSHSATHVNSQHLHNVSVAKYGWERAPKTSTVPRKAKTAVPWDWSSPRWG